MEETKKIQNIVSLAGVVVSMYETYACKVLTLAVSQPVRLRDGSFRVETNYPKIYFFKSDITGVDEIREGMNVTTIGHLSAPRKTRPDTGRAYYSQSIIGETVKENKTAIAEAGVNIGRSTEAENIVYLEGVVERVERVTDNITLFTVAAYNKRFYNRIRVTSYDNRDMAVAPGNTVSISAYVRTPQKIGDNGEKIRHQNIVARTIKDLGKLPDTRVKRDYQAEKQVAIKESYSTEPLEAV